MDTTMSCQSGHLPHTATWGLLGAWALHDLEELVMIPGWSRRARPRLKRALPWVPSRVWDTLDVSPGHSSTAIGLLGLAVARAAPDRARTNAPNGLYPARLSVVGRP